MTLSRHDDLVLDYVLNVPSGKSDDAEMPLVIMLHGRGADANDLADLAPMMDGPSGYRFVFPNAPQKFEPSPGMAFGYTWFEGWPPEGDSIVQSRSKLLTLIDELLARYPTPEGKIVLAGFSQGGLMSLDVGFRCRPELSGIVVMSGAIYADDLPDLRAHSDMRVLIVHGTEDEVIPVMLARRTRRLLEKSGVQPPEYHEFPMGHQVTTESMAVVAAFLQRCLG